MTTESGRTLGVLMKSWVETTISCEDNNKSVVLVLFTHIKLVPGIRIRFLSIPFHSRSSCIVCNISCTGGHDTFFSFFSFFFRLLCFLCFLSFVECVCRACRIQYDDMAWHCLNSLLTAYVATWCIYVT